MLNGTNKLCQQCIKDCKQWAQVKIVKCPNHVSGQSKEREVGVPLIVDETPESPHIAA